MGFLDKFRKKKEEPEPQKQDSSKPQTGKRVKKYTSDGKPVYE